MDIFSKNEEDKDIFEKNGEKSRDWGYRDPPYKNRAEFNFQSNDPMCPKFRAFSERFTGKV